MTVRPTKRQFKLFEREVRRWQRELGLRSWEIFVDFQPRETQATRWWDAESRVANINLSSTQPGVFSDEYIKRFALHECLELLLSGCTDIMREARSEGECSKNLHTVIRALENAVLGDPK